MTVDRLIETRGSFLAAVAERIYCARRRFLAERFDGYAADTYYVRGSGYYCWPAVTDGVFEGYAEPVPGEEAAIDDLAARGFEPLGVGRSRITCAVPGGEHAVKFGRCGMGDGYCAGRRANLVEATVSRSGVDLPIVPCRYAAPRGEFAVYPRATPVAGVDELPGGERRLREIRSRFAEACPSLDADELTRIENVGLRDGETVTFDYADPAAVDFPAGVPAHVDPDDVVDAVDERRRRGSKRDLRDGGGFADGP